MTTHRHRRRPSHRGAGLRSAARQLRGSLRPAAEPDRQAQDGHHRGGALEGHRRVHRPRQGGRRPSGTSSRPRRSCWSPRRCSTSRPLGCCPQGDVEDEDDLALLEARDLLFARLMQYKAFKLVVRRARAAAGRGDQAAPALRRAGGAVRRSAARGADRDRARAVRGPGGQGAGAQARAGALAAAPARAPGQRARAGGPGRGAAAPYRHDDVPGAVRRLARTP